MIKFGTSGNSNSFYEQGYKSTTQALAWIASLNLSAYEYSFGRGINLSEPTANILASEAIKNNVTLSVHAPYYINLANPDEEMIKKSFGYITRSAEKAQQMGAKRIVVHAATVGKLTREQSFNLTIERTKKLIEHLYENGYQNMQFAFETMGKINQIGTLDEIIQLCKLDKIIIPTIDFGHLNARTLGGLKTINDYEKIILSLIDGIGFDRTSDMHCHFSKIEYSAGGEVKHLTFADERYGPSFPPLAEILTKYNLCPTIICESDGTQAEDAVEMLDIYNKLQGAK